MTVPSARKASACAYPAAMATTLVRSFGTMVWPDELSPQAATVPSAFSTMLKLSPPATATAFVKSSGTMAWPRSGNSPLLVVPAPQATTVLAAKPVGMERNRHTRNRHHTLPTNRQHPTFNIEHSTSNRSEVGSGIECSVFDVGC